MKTKQSHKYPLLALVTSLAVFAALWATPGTTHAQTPTPIPNLFVSVNAQPVINGGSFIYQYDPTGSTGTYTSFVSNVDHPRGVAFDSAGHLFVSTMTFGFDADDNIVSSHGAVLKVSEGVASTFATLSDGFAEGLATDSAGNLFVSSQKFDETESTIYQITPDGVVSTFGSVPGQCFGLAFNSAGNLLAAGADPTLTCGAIYQFTSPDVKSYFIGPDAFCSGPGPVDLTFDTNGNLFASVSDGSSNSGIRRFAADGTEITPQVATGLTHNPRGLRFDSDGNLFLAEPGIPGTTIIGDILKFSPGGTGTIPGITTAPDFGVAYFDDGATGDFGTRGNRGPEFLAFSPPAITLTPPSTSVVLTFPDATEPVTTTLVASVDQNSVPPPPSNFELQTGGPSLAYEITAGTPPTPPIIIGFTVPASLYGSDGSGLKALHDDNGTWVDSTIYSTDPNYPSPAAPNTIYASVSHLSPFLVAKFKYGAQVQQPINADGTSVFNAKRGVIPVAFTLTSDGVPTCELPAATISVFRTSGGVVGSIDESVYLLASDTGSNFRIDTANCKYVYNLGSKSLGPGTYQVFISIGGTVAGSATFALK
jgi:hypothetical protein